jgi:pimeloyl-[acyl-carrier protein] methyl ester esterase
LQVRGDRRAAALLAELRRVAGDRDPPAPVALASGLAVLTDTDLRHRLAAVVQASLVISGERDRLTPAEAGRRLAAGLPAGRFFCLPGAAHAPFLTHPGEFVTAVAAFLLDEAVVT